jgi:DNA-binding MarR family transcriptional regulator
LEAFGALVLLGLAKIACQFNKLPPDRAQAKNPPMSRKDSAATSLEGLRKWREAVPNDRLAHVIKDLFRTIQRSLQLRLAVHSVSIGQWVFLRILWERDAITQRELSELAGVSEPTTYSALLSMEKQGLITRQKLAGNMRNLSVCLTPKGRALRATLVPLAEEVNALVIGGLSVQELAAFRQTVLRMIANLEAEDSGAPLRSESSAP